jgi:putative two-component system response regulator
MAKKTKTKNTKKSSKKKKTKKQDEKKKILAIDDDPDILVSVGTILEKSGYEVICAEGGRQAIDYLESDDENMIPDLIILDIMMPIVSGWDVHRELKCNPKWKNIPVIFLTARGTETAKEMAADRGCLYVRKPFDVKDLRKKIKKELDKK